MSAALAELWERREGGVLRAESYLELGGLATVVERLGEQALAIAGDQHVDAVRRILLMLADVTDDGVWTRRRMPIGELPRDGRALDALVSSRLVVRSDETVEIIHEIVFRAWPQLTAWLDEARLDLVLERELRLSARNWDSDGRPEDNLFRGTRLQAALEWAERSTEPIAAVVTEFLTAARRLADRHDHEIRQQLQRERRARRRISWALVAAGVLLVSAVVAGATAINSRNDANHAAALAEARRVSTQALASEDYDRALLLAVEGRHLDDSTETRSNLLEAIQRSPDAVAVIRSDREAFRDLSLTPDGTTLLASGAGARPR